MNRVQMGAQRGVDVLPYIFPAYGFTGYSNEPKPPVSSWFTKTNLRLTNTPWVILNPVGLTLCA